MFYLLVHEQGVIVKMSHLLQAKQQKSIELSSSSMWCDNFILTGSLLVCVWGERISRIYKL